MVQSSNSNDPSGIDDGQSSRVEETENGGQREENSPRQTGSKQDVDEDLASLVGGIPVQISADYEDIERRASELAARLGDSGKGRGGARQPSVKMTSGGAYAATGRAKAVSPSRTRSQQSHDDQRLVDVDWKPNQNIMATTEQVKLGLHSRDGIDDLEPIIKAEIHEEDLDMDRLPTFSNETLADVGVWEQDADEEGKDRTSSDTVNANDDISAHTEFGLEMSKPEQKAPNIENALRDVSLFLSDTVREHAESPGGFVQSEQDESTIGFSTGEHDPVSGEVKSIVDGDNELDDLVRQIEVLTQSMSDQPLHGMEVDASDVLAPEIGVSSNVRTGSSAHSVELEDENWQEAHTDLENRLDTLETQIARLFNEMARNNQKIEARLSTIAGHRNIGVSAPRGDVLLDIAELREQMERIEELRRHQEERTADSLDALHDALRDLSDRFSLFQRQNITLSAEELGTSGSATGEAITSRDEYEIRGDARGDALSSADAGNLEPVEGYDDDLPLWLEDAGGGFLPQGNGSKLKAEADVFQKDGEVSGETAQASVLSGTEAGKKDVPRSSLKKACQVEELSVPVTDENVMLEGAEVQEIDEWEQAHDRKQASVSDVRQHSDFIQQARAKAMGITETQRTHIRLDVSDSNNVTGEAVGVPRARKEEKRKDFDPFSVKKNRPNLFFIIAIMVLFGTSALLLFGMLRHQSKEGSVTPVNADERLNVPASKAGEPASNSMHRGEKEQSQGGGDDKRSELELFYNKKVGSGISVAGLHNGNSNADASSSSPAQVTITPLSGDVETTSSVGQSSNAKMVSSRFPGYQRYGSRNDAHAGKIMDSFGDEKREDDLPVTIGPLSLRTNAMKGDAKAQYMVAVRYQKGVGVENDERKAAEWFRKSANGGYAPAFYSLGTMFERGTGVTLDLQQARDLYLASAEKGNIKAMHNLAVLYTNGGLGKPDYPSALKWYRNAADHGLSDSQFNMAIIYQNGLGVPSNLEEAYKWYSLAARSGDKEAKEVVQEMRNDLPFAKRNMIDREVSLWKPSAPNHEANIEDAADRIITVEQ